MRKSNDTSLVTGEAGSGKNIIEHTSSLNESLLEQNCKESRQQIYVPQAKLLDMSDIILRSQSAGGKDKMEGSLEANETIMLGYVVVLA